MPACDAKSACCGYHSASWYASFSPTYLAGHLAKGDLFAAYGGFTANRVVLTMGATADRFVFNTAVTAGTHVDTGVDFVSGSDRILLDHAILTALCTRALARPALSPKPPPWSAMPMISSCLTARAAIFYRKKVAPTLRLGVVGTTLALGAYLSHNKGTGRPT